MGFGQGLSGLNAASQNLDVIGNNIANSGTVGFKSGTATFADIYATSRVGLGVQVASINQRFTTGVVSTTGNQFDMAIDGANGLFVVKMPGAETLYTRNGQFIADKNNNIVNAQGQQLMGYPPVMDTSVTPPKPVEPSIPNMGAPLQGLKVPYGNIEPRSTSELLNKLNLDSSVDAITAAFDPTNSATYNKASPVTVYDSLGNSHTITQYFVKTGSNAWDVHYTYPDPANNVTPPPIPLNPPKALTGSPVSLTFTSEGIIPPPPAPAPIFNLTIPAADLDGASALAFDVDFNGSTQFANSYTMNFTQDGYATGEYASMSIGTDGAVIANYTNGAKRAMGYVALANFNNLQGLQPVGGNAWSETAGSGQPIFGTPGTNSMATLKGQAVEESNVDMSQELVNMIIAQRTYQANAQTIKTQDQIMQTLISMR